MQAADIMTANVVTARPDTSVNEIANTLLTQRISAVPIVDDEDQMIGIVSEEDLIRRIRSDDKRIQWSRLFLDHTAAFKRDCGTRAKDVMTSEVVTVKEDASLAEVANIFERQHIKRVPVLRDGRIVGIVSRADLLRTLAEAKYGLGDSSLGQDYEIKMRIIDVIAKNTSISLHGVRVIVLNSVVYLWGIAETSDVRTTVRIAAENVVGVGNVFDYLRTAK